jgi:RND family efflux transporter MFP subunit
MRNTTIQNSYLATGKTAMLTWALAASMPGAALGAPTSQEFDCLIEPAQVVEVRSPVAGLLQQVHARRGDTIRKGQVLVSIESSVERSVADAAGFRAATQGAVQLARNKAAAAREKALRMAELQAEEFVSVQARDDAAAEARLAADELISAQESAQLAKFEHRQALDQLNRRILRSPFNGVVVDQHLYPGALVDPSEGKKPILRIAQTQPLGVQAILPYRYFPSVKSGSRVVIRPEKPFSGDITTTIASVDKVIDSAAGTFGVHVLLPNIRNELPGGIRCKLVLSVQ